MDVQDQFGNQSDDAPDSLDSAGTTAAQKDGGSWDSFLTVLSKASGVIKSVIPGKEEFGQANNPTYQPTAPASIATTKRGIFSNPKLLIGAAVVLVAVLFFFMRKK